MAPLQADYPFGKRQRFRDWGMWLVDDEATQLDAHPRYLVLKEDQPIADAAPWTCARGNDCSAQELHVRGKQHVDHLNRLRQRLAAGVALARVLNRTLVLPTFYCYCDKFWHRLHACAIADAADGAQPLPFLCPMDHVSRASPPTPRLHARMTPPAPRPTIKIDPQPPLASGFSFLLFSHARAARRGHPALPRPSTPRRAPL